MGSHVSPPAHVYPLGPALPKAEVDSANDRAQVSPCAAIPDTAGRCSPPRELIYTGQGSIAAARTPRTSPRPNSLPTDMALSNDSAALVGVVVEAVLMGTLVHTFTPLAMLTRTYERNIHRPLYCINRPTPPSAAEHERSHIYRQLHSVRILHRPFRA